MIRAVHLLRPDHESHVGGDLVHLHAWVEALKAAGVDARAASWQDPPAEADIVHLYNVQLYAQLLRNYRRARKQWPDAKVVLTPIFWRSDLAPWLRARDRYVSVKAFKRNLKSRAAWGLVRRVIRAADAVFPQSQSELDSIARHFALTASASWQPVPIGVWLNQWPHRESRGAGSDPLPSLDLDLEGRAVVANVGRVEPRKNQALLVKAVSRVPEAALLLIGPAGDTPGYTERTFRLAKELLPGRWAWLGALDHPGVREVLYRTSIHALPSFRESVGLASLEAAAAGCEIVVTDDGPMKEYFGNHAHYCKPHSAEQIARALKNAIDKPKQPDLRARVEEFDWSAAGRLLADCYQKMLRSDS